jgi:acyl carrier protein
MSTKIETELLELFNELGLDVEKKDPPVDDIVLADLGADSLTIMDLCVALEEKYDFTVEPADVMRQGTVRNLAAYIAGKLPEQA